MKKLKLILLVISCVLLAGCGGDEEAPYLTPNDPTLVGDNIPGPRVDWVVPANGALGVNESGTVVVVKFDREMIPESVNFGTVSVVGFSGQAWPNVDDTSAPVVTAITITSAENNTKFSFSQTDYFPSSECFTLTISGALAKDGTPMPSARTSCFCTDQGDGTCP